MAFIKGQMKFEHRELDREYINSYQKKFNLKRHELVRGFNYNRFGQKLEQETDFDEDPQI